MSAVRKPISRENIPVLITSFNRPDLLKQVLNAVFTSGCQNIYFATDGPRNSEDRFKIDECLRLFHDFYPHIKSERILEHQFNLGCRLAMAQNVRWFFNQVKMGIVLEDDCLPSSSFFDYMISCLEQFEFDSEVFMISGYSPLSWQGKESIRKSIYPLVWGWGSWSDRISCYKLNFKDYKGVVTNGEALGLGRVWGFFGRIKWRLLMNMAGTGVLNTWDYSLTATAWREKKYSIHSSKNYIENLGFRSDATHTNKFAPQWARRKISSGKFGKDSMNTLPFAEVEAELDLELGRQIFTATFEGWLRLKLSLIRSKLQF
jgi:hypothetical protein